MAKVAIDDLSGSTTPVTANPYDGLILAADHDPKKIQERYEAHRTTRNRQQRAKILAADFPGWTLDEHLTRLEGPQRERDYGDPRHCLVFWARPPQAVKDVIGRVQQRLKHAAPDLWLMPIDRLHMTALEVAHSRTEADIELLVSALRPLSKAIADLDHRPGPRLVRPMLSYDSAALALSFVPDGDDGYTYHHLRRDVYARVSGAGIDVGSRYVVPSAHLTIARFNTPNPFGGGGGPLDASVSRDVDKRRRWLAELDAINAWLEAEFWPDGRDTSVKPGGEWLVGEEMGLDFRKGTLWYGGGETVYLGVGTTRP